MHQNVVLLYWYCCRAQKHSKSTWVKSLGPLWLETRSPCAGTGWTGWGPECHAGILVHFPHL